VTATRASRRACRGLCRPAGARPLPSRPFPWQLDLGRRRTPTRAARLARRAVQRERLGAGPPRPSGLGSGGRLTVLAPPRGSSLASRALTAPSSVREALLAHGSRRGAARALARPPAQEGLLPDVSRAACASLLPHQRLASAPDQLRHGLPSDSAHPDPPPRYTALSAKEEEGWGGAEEVCYAKKPASSNANPPFSDANTPVSVGHQHSVVEPPWSPHPMCVASQGLGPPGIPSKIGAGPSGGAEPPP